MPDVFTKAKRSQVMSRIRGRGNRETELVLASLFRRHGITGWRRPIQIRNAERGTRNAEQHLTPALSPARRRSACSSGLRLSLAQGGGVWGRLFLAWLSEARDVAGAPRGVVASEAGGEPGRGTGR
jgi:hypothetical protein